MNPIQERQQNQAVYHLLKNKIRQDYPPGRFVAIVGGQVAADAETLEELLALLREKGIDPVQALIVEAGVDYPESATI